MPRLQINKIEPEIRGLYFKEDNGTFTFIGLVNEYEFTDFRIQIKRRREKEPKYRKTEYHVKFNDEFVPIDTDGRIEFPKGLFDLSMDQLMELF